jgi:hypothetical protein
VRHGWYPADSVSPTVASRVDEEVGSAAEAMGTGACVGTV